MKTIKNLVFLIFVILISDAQKIKMSGRRACMKVKETLGKQAQCEHGEEHLIFFQNSNIGNVVKFSKKDELKLKIECLNFRVGIDLDRIPQLNFESINKIELSGCSVSNSSLLSAIKSSFRIKKVKSLTITSTNEPNLVTVPDDLFKDFTELEELEMTTSFRVSYNKTVFKALTSLKTLKLHVNDIIALPSIIFEPLENVRNLVLSGSGSPKHEAKKFNIVLNKCINMQTFTLTGIRWPVQIGALVNFVGPLKVSILHNRFGSEISSRAFEKASYIEKLFLTNNSIKSLPKDVFAWQTSMTVIDVSFNLIVELHNDIFKAARSLEIINLSHNQITFITRKFFQYSRHLTRLNLSYNQLSQIDFAANIGILNSLQVLDFSHNNVGKLLGNLSCSNLTTLELSHNKFKRIFIDQFWEFSRKNLTINLRENLIESVDFRDLNYLESLVNMRNMTVNIDEEITCNCHTLSLYNFTMKKLKIDKKLYDSIKILPKNSKCMKKSNESPRSVSDIQIESITCPLDFPHQVFCPSSCLCDRRPFDSFLIVKCTNISSVPLMPRFKTLKDIKLDKIELSISANGIKSLPSKKCDHNFNDVTIIHASHNSIQQISVDNIPDRLEILDLKHNRLSHIPADVIAKFTKLHLLHLSNNPWDCAEAKDLVRFVKRYREIEKDFNMVQCSSYEYFLEIETEDQCTGRFQSIFVIFAGVVFILVIATVYCIKRAAITEWIFVHDKHHLLERAIELTKLFDGIVCVANNDKVFSKYIAAKLLERPNKYKIGMIMKDWNATDPIPKNVLKGFRNSRRVVVVLSEYFEESDWTRWNYFNTNTRIIFIVKGKKATESIGISNMMLIKFGDPWFWEKLKHAMTRLDELSFDEQHTDAEMQPLQNINVK